MDSTRSVEGLARERSAVDEQWLDLGQRIPDDGAVMKHGFSTAPSSALDATATAGSPPVDAARLDGAIISSS